MISRGGIVCINRHIIIVFQPFHVAAIKIYGNLKLLTSHEDFLEDYSVRQKKKKPSLTASSYKHTPIHSTYAHQHLSSSIAVALKFIITDTI